MPTAPPRFKAPGQKTERERKKALDKRRGTAAQRGYGHKWRKASKRFLQNHPLCRYCEQEGRITPATVVDHIKPHKGHSGLFWDTDNWQPLCKTHHDEKTAREQGHYKGADESGVPIDPAHPWNKG